MSLKQCTHQNWGTAEQAHILWRPNTRDPNTEAKYTRASAWLRSGCSLKWKLKPFGSFSKREKTFLWKIQCCLSLSNQCCPRFVHASDSWVNNSQPKSKYMQYRKPPSNLKLFLLFLNKLETSDIWPKRLRARWETWLRFEIGGCSSSCCCRRPWVLRNSHFVSRLLA